MHRRHDPAAAPHPVAAPAPTPDPGLATRGLAAALVVTTVLGLGLATAGTAAAQGSARRVVAPASSGPSVSLTPRGAAGRSGYFVFSARRGRVLRGSFAITNVSRSAAGTVRLYGVDATTGQTTGAVYRSANQPRHDVGRWLRLSTRRVTLAPGARAVVRFSVRVPRNASVGQHLGGIVAQPTVPVGSYRSQHSGHRFQIKVQALTVLAVQLDVPGRTLQRLALGGCQVGGQHHYQTLYVGMRNTGNVMLKGSGQLTVATSAGRRVKRQRFNVDTFVPRTRIAYPVILRGRPLGSGRYRATVAVRYGSRHMTRRTVTCTVSRRSITQVFGSPAAAAIPGPGTGGGIATWLLALGAVAVFVVGFGGAGLLFRARQRS